MRLDLGTVAGYDCSIRCYLAVLLISGIVCFDWLFCGHGDIRAKSNCLLEMLRHANYREITLVSGLRWKINKDCLVQRWCRIGLLLAIHKDRSRQNRKNLLGLSSNQDLAQSNLHYLSVLVCSWKGRIRLCYCIELMGFLCLELSNQWAIVSFAAQSHLGQFLVDLVRNCQRWQLTIVLSLSQPGDLVFPTLVAGAVHEFGKRK